MMLCCHDGSHHWLESYNWSFACCVLSHHIARLSYLSMFENSKRMKWQEVTIYSYNPRMLWECVQQDLAIPIVLLCVYLQYKLEWAPFILSPHLCHTSNLAKKELMVSFIQNSQSYQYRTPLLGKMQRVIWSFKDTRTFYRWNILNLYNLFLDLKINRSQLWRKPNNCKENVECDAKEKQKKKNTNKAHWK